MSEPERYLTVDEAAELVSYPESVILDWMARGLPHVVPEPGKRTRRDRIRIRRSALQAYVNGLEVVRVPAEPDPTRPRATAPRSGASPSAGLSAWRERPGRN